MATLIDTECMMIGAAATFVPQLNANIPGGQLTASALCAAAYKWYKGANQQGVMVGALNGGAGGYVARMVMPR